MVKEKKTKMFNGGRGKSEVYGHCLQKVGDVITIFLLWTGLGDSSDVDPDPDPVRSGFIWVRGSRGIKSLIK